MNSVLKLRVCHFSYVTLVSEGVLIVFFPRKRKRQGALIGAGALNGANTVDIESTTYMASCLLPKTTKAFQNGVCSERKEFAPLGANSFLLELTPFEKGGQNERAKLLS